jgi:hypothetical protein
VVSAGKKDEDWKKIKELLDNSHFNIQNYYELDAYFTRCGHRDRADTVFIAGKRKATRRLPRLKRWSTIIFWDLLTGYGRKPYQSLYGILICITLGALFFSPVFDPKFMASYGFVKQMAQNYPWSTKIILSLDRFLPGVDLGVAKHWAPATICNGLWIYWHLQKLLGWILIPITLAAIYTRIK